MRVNRLHYKNLFRAILVILLGLGILYELAGSNQGDYDYFMIFIYVLCCFFGIIMAPIGIITRYIRGTKYRRRFFYSLTGSANLLFGLMTAHNSLTAKDHQTIAIVLTIISFLTGLYILYDIFFTRREKRKNQEYASI